MLFDLLYLLVLLVGSPLILVRWLVRGRRPHHNRVKLGHIEPLEGGCDVLVHCVSVGETEAAVPIVRRLVSSGKKVVVSVTTATGSDVAHLRFPDLPVVFFPYDFSWAVRRFVNAVSPRCVALMELELWPNFIRECSRKRVPVLILNGRMTERSLGGYRSFRSLLKKTWNSLSWIGVQDELQAERFRGAGAPADRVVVSGSVKFDKEPPEGHEKAREELGFSREDLVIMAGSTHKGEEELVLDAWSSLSGNKPGLVIAPRHPERVAAVRSLLESRNIPYALRSTKTPSTVILLDTMGELARLYGAADIVVMGGTLLPGVGGHNPIEPAVLGRFTVSGPHFSNFKEVTRKLEEDAGLVVLENIAELNATIARAVSDGDWRAKVGANACNSVQRNAGSLGRYVRAIADSC